MKMKIKTILQATFCLALVTFTLSSEAKLTVFQHNGRLKVSGTKLLNAQGYQIQLRGMSTHGLQWHRDCLTDEALDVLANTWGADILRLSMYVQEGGLDSLPDFYTRRVDTLVTKVKKLGIYALIDFHMLDPGDPNENLELAKTYFEHMSSTHGGTGQVLYDICNEPNGDDVDWACIKRYANVIIPIIRRNDPNSIIIVGTPSWAARPDVVINDKLPYENVLYTMHFYAASHGEDYRSVVKAAVNGGVPVFVTEWGSQEASGDGQNDWQSTDAWISLLKSNKISWCNWNYSDDFLSGAVWKNNGTECTFKGPFTDNNLKESGVHIKKYIGTPADDFGPEPPTNLQQSEPIVNKKYLLTIASQTSGSEFSITLSGLDKKVNDVWLRVYTVGGVCLYSRHYPDFAGCAVWDGRDASGKKSAAGSYILKAQIGSQTIVCDFVKM